LNAFYPREIGIRQLFAAAGVTGFSPHLKGLAWSSESQELEEGFGKIAHRKRREIQKCGRFQVQKPEGGPSKRKEKNT